MALGEECDSSESKGLRTSWHRSPIPGPAAWPGAKLSAQDTSEAGLGGEEGELLEGAVEELEHSL